MAERIIKNQLNGKVTLHSVTNVSITIVGNNSVSNVATGAEVVSGASIKRIWWGSDGAAGILIKRGSNSVAILTGTGYHDYAEHGDALNLDPAATFVATLPANGFIMVELSKAFSTAANTGY